MYNLQLNTLLFFNIPIKTFDTNVLMGIVAILILVILSALASGSEVALFSLNKYHIDKIKDESKSTLKSIIEKPKLLLATLLIANTFVNISIIVVGSFIINSIFDFSNFPVLSFFIQTILFTSFILLFGEVLPKTLATVNPLKFALILAKPLIYVIKILKPLSILLIKTSSIIDKHIEKKLTNISLDDLSNALEITSNPQSKNDDKILKGIISFSETEVTEIMQPRIDSVYINKNSSLDEIMAHISTTGYSRMPVFENNVDNIVGILHIKDILLLLKDKSTVQWQTLIRPAMFVPETKKINDLLQDFRNKKMHLAIVVDEYGGTSGIVTMEDVIEEILGEINDEFDTSNDAIYTKINDTTFIFDAKVQLNDFFKIIQINESIVSEITGDHDTLAGLLLEIAGEIPRTNKIIKYKNLEFKIESANSRRIKRIKVNIHEAS